MMNGALRSLAVLLMLLGLAGPALSAQDPGVALGFYRALAEDGSADAQLALGDHYRQGDGVATDLVEAYAWYYVAAHQGLKEAVTPMNEVFRALSARERPLAKQRAEGYARQYVP